jgi:hypothetical protein
MNHKKNFVKILFVVINLVVFIGLIWLHLETFFIFEILLALIFIQILIAGFFGVIYFLHHKFKILSNKLKFRFLTRFLEQPRMEGTYKDNWWQIHFASRSYSEYWGIPRTYIKLQFKTKNNFDKKKLAKYNNYKYEGNEVYNIVHIKRSYKNYLLMRITWYILNPKEITHLMDFLLNVSKEAKKK